MSPTRQLLGALPVLGAILAFELQSPPAVQANFGLDDGIAIGDVTPFVLEKATRGDIRRIVTGSGVVKPLVSVLVGSQLSGQIVDIKANFNSEVREGDILASLDDKMFSSRVTQAQAQLEVAKSELQNSKAVLEKTTAQQEHARQALERQQTLTKTNATTRALLDDALRDTQVTQAETAIARAQVASAAGNLRHREALLAEAQIDLEKTQIRAPITGVVLSRMVEIGQTVAASLQSPELFRIAQNLEHVQVEAQIGEAEIGGVRQGDPVTFGVDAYPNSEFMGRVADIRLAPNVEQNIVTYTVVIDVDNGDRRLFPGMTANVRIETEWRRRVLRVPLAALSYRPVPASTQTNQPHVPPTDRREIWVAGANAKLEPRTIRVGVSDNDLVEITTGSITEDTQIAIRKHSSQAE